MKIVCDSCATKYSISDDKVRGKVFKIRCKKCSHIIVVRGTSDAPAPAAGAGGSDGGWHLVVEGEQVGPLGEAEIRGRFSRGEIDNETYIWKEGFADWLKLGTVPEFADIVAPAPSESSGSIGGGDLFSDSQPVSAPHAHAGEAVVSQQAVASSSGRVGGGLFGAIDAVGASAGGESDAFAAPAAAVARGGGGGNLFAAHAATHSLGGDDGRRGGASNHDGGRVENLTAQRHENSVLFSLANLQSLAMPGAGAAKAAPSAISNNNAGPSDGSGLIDIRAMAATTMGMNDARVGLGDDLPAFGSFASAAPVLLPVSSQSGPPKWIFAVFGGMVLLLGAIGVMAFKIFTAKPVTVVEAAPALVAPPAPPVAPAAPGAIAAPVPGKTAPAAPAAPAIADENLPPREGAPAPAEAKRERGEKTGRHGKPGREKKGGATAEASGGGKAGASAPAAAASAPEPAEKKAKTSNSLDDLLDNALSGRKPRRAAASDDDGPKKTAPEPVSAGPLAKDAVVRGMNGVRSKVSDCYGQFKVAGTAMVNVVIGKTGKVSSATVTGKFAGTPTGACVEKAVKTASFPPSDGFSTPYPFSLK